MNIRETLINKNLPVHEQLMFCLLLTLVGGFFDAYTFVNCGGIFANAQTGNLIFVGIGLINGDLYEVRHYLIPVLSFIVGVLVSKYIESKLPDRHLKKSESRYPFLIYLTVVLVFLFGVIFGAAMSKYYFHNAILAPIAIMIVNLFFVIGIQNKFGKKRI